MKDRATGERNKRFLWRCKDCGKQYTVRVNTVMQDSAIPLTVWCFAFWHACASKKGVSALQIQRMTGLSYKSSLFLMHRIRHAMKATNPSRLMDGVIEADETFVGGIPRQRQRSFRHKRDVNYQLHKTPVMVLIEREGEARSMILPTVNGKMLRKAIRDNVTRESALVTDDCRSYIQVGKEQEGGHHTVTHSMREYVRGPVYTNTAESFFSIMKRGINGTFHAVSKKHLHRYVDEFTYRWNTHKDSDGARIAKAIRGAEGKRLMYKEPTGSAHVA